MSNEAVKPCPFCGVDLTPNTNRADLYVRRYGPHYQHPTNDCRLSGDEISPSEVEGWNRRAASPVAADTMGDAKEPPELPPLSDTHRQLMKFYGVITLRALVNAQAHHIEKLQAKLPPTPGLGPQRVREG